MIWPPNNLSWHPKWAYNDHGVSLESVVWAWSWSCSVTAVLLLVQRRRYSFIRIPGPYPGFYFNRGKNTPPFPFLSHSFFFFSLSPFSSSPPPMHLSPFLIPSFPHPLHFILLPFSPFSSFLPPPSRGPTPFIQLEGPGERCKLRQRVRAEPGRHKWFLMYFEFWVSERFWW